MVMHNHAEFLATFPLHRLYISNYAKAYLFRKFPGEQINKNCSYQYI